MKPGVHTVNEKRYHSDPCEQPSLSASIAKLLVQRSPLHAWQAHPRLNPDWEPVETTVFDIGKAAHAMLLEGVNGVHVVEYNDWRTTKAQEDRAIARAAGRYPLLLKDWTRVQDMVKAAKWQLLTVDPIPFTDGKPEQTLIWEEDGVHCRARLDWLRHDHRFIDDYKTAANGEPARWTRGSLFDNGYDIQAAFYLRGLKALTGKDAEFRFAVQEKQPPYALTIVGLTPAVLELANLKVNAAIQVWKDCLGSGVWPGYPSEVCYAELPAWEEARWLEREQREVAA